MPTVELSEVLSVLRRLMLTVQRHFESKHGLDKCLICGGPVPQKRQR